MDEPGQQLQVNTRFWQSGGQVRQYDRRTLSPAEVLLLVRYRDELAARVLDIGCGAGRVLSYLVELGGEVHGVDVSPDMVETCRRRYPEAAVQVADVRGISRTVTPGFTAIVASDNVLDVFDDAVRREVLTELRGLLSPNGILAFSSHNLAHVETDSPARARAQRVRELASKALERPPSDVLDVVRAMPRRRRNRRRLGPLERHASDHAVLNDEAHHFSLLHYYIRRDDQARQLGELGFELLECLDGDGRLVGTGEPGRGSSLLYVARA